MRLVIAEMGWASCVGLASAVLLTWFIAVVVMLGVFHAAPISESRPVVRRSAAETRERTRIPSSATNGVSPAAIVVSRSLPHTGASRVRVTDVRTKRQLHCVEGSVE
jgi:hypothetical protein